MHFIFIKQEDAMHESGEMYLETIYVLSKNNTPVRSIDIAAEMGFSKPSISRAVRILKEGGFVEVDDNGYITLTETGLEYAKKIYERHNVLTEFFLFLGVDKATASEDACKIEHVISDESMNKIKAAMLERRVN